MCSTPTPISLLPEQAKYRNLSFEIISCKNIEFDKYLDTAY